MKALALLLAVCFAVSNVVWEHITTNLSTEIQSLHSRQLVLEGEIVKQKFLRSLDHDSLDRILPIPGRPLPAIDGTPHFAPSTSDKET